MAKGRPSDNPLIVHVADISEVSTYVKRILPLEKRLMEAFWPGPLTIVFPKKILFLWQLLVDCGQLLLDVLLMRLREH